MKIKIIVTTLFISLFANNALAENMTIKMIAYKDCHPDVNKLDFASKPQTCNMSNQAMTFMVEGKNIAVLDKDSLNFSKLSIGDSDIRHNRKGDKNYSMGSFPKVDDNGNFAVFDIEFESAPFGKVSSISIDGSLEILTSERVVVNENKGLDLNQGFILDIGPFVVSDKPIQAEKINDAAVGNALAKGLQTAFMGSSNDGLPIYVQGNMDAFVSIEIFENGQKIDQGWSTIGKNDKTINFSKTSGSIIDLNLKYWDGLARVTLPIKR